MAGGRPVRRMRDADPTEWDPHCDSALRHGVGRPTLAVSSRSAPGGAWSDSARAGCILGVCVYAGGKSARLAGCPAALGVLDRALTVSAPAQRSLCDRARRAVCVAASLRHGAVRFLLYDCRLAVSGDGPWRDS